MMPLWHSSLDLTSTFSSTVTRSYARSTPSSLVCFLEQWASVGQIQWHWSYTCRAPVKTSPPTNQHPVFLQELLMVRHSWKNPRWAWGEQVPGMWYFFPSVLWHCCFGDRKGIWPVKHWVLVCWWLWFEWSYARLIAPVVTTIFHHPQLQ